MKFEKNPNIFFRQLGDRVEALWAGLNYDEAAFSDAATRALVDLPPCEHVSFYDAVKIGLLNDPLPTQQDLQATFGQPPLTVYWGREFRIELLFWVEGLPGIHQHGFSGAFHVLSGSSLQTQWVFKPTRRVVSRLYFGTTSLTKAELLTTGASSPIIAGSRMIHSTFHLERPSVTCVVRTNREADQLPQYSYIPPSIAYAPLEVCPTIERRIQLLRMLIDSEKLAECFELISHVFEQADSYAAFQYLLALHARISEGAERDLMLSAAQHRHRDLIDAMQPALEENERRNTILRLRRSIANPDLQFFLALLLNVPARPLIFSLIKERYGSRDPQDLVIGWLRDLSMSGALEVRWAESWFAIARELLSDQSSRIPPNEQDSSAQLLRENLKNYWLLHPLFHDWTAETAHEPAEQTISWDGTDGTDGHRQLFPEASA